MKKVVFIVLALVAIILISETAYARGRKGSHRVGGYNSHGKGGHYVGGY